MRSAPHIYLIFDNVRILSICFTNEPRPVSGITAKVNLKNGHDRSSMRER